LKEAESEVRRELRFATNQPEAAAIGNNSHSSSIIVTTYPDQYNEVTLAFLALFAVASVVISDYYDVNATPT
jgi:hypothetical protein